MELTHQLTPKLKQLRLSGILDTLEVRTRAALDGQWSYVEFLERLLEDEVERRAQKQLALRLRRGGGDTTKNPEGYDLRFQPAPQPPQGLPPAARGYIPPPGEPPLFGAPGGGG